MPQTRFSDIPRSQTERSQGGKGDRRLRQIRYFQAVARRRPSGLPRAGDRQTMSVPEKIDFLHKVHREEISLWDDDGSDNEIFNDYHAVENELLDHPESIQCEDLLRLLKIFDDDCFEISWQFHLSKMVFYNCCRYGRPRIAFYLQHLPDVPAGGRFHGWHFPIQWLLEGTTFPDFKAAVQEQPEEIRHLVAGVLDKVGIYPEARDELKAIVNP